MYILWPIREVLFIANLDHDDSFNSKFDRKLTFSAAFLKAHKEYVYNTNIPHALCICENSSLLTRGLNNNTTTREGFALYSRSAHPSRSLWRRVHSSRSKLFEDDWDVYRHTQTTTTTTKSNRARRRTRRKSTKKRKHFFIYSLLLQLLYMYNFFYLSVTNKFWWTFH